MTDFLAEELARSDEKAAMMKERKRLEVLREQEARKKKDLSRHIILGAMVCKYFPSVSHFEPGTQAQNAAELAPFDAFLAVLSEDQELLAGLRDKVNHRLSRISQ